MAENTKTKIALPEQLISSVDMSRIIRELEALDESLRQAEIRKPGTPTKLSRSSVTLEDLARLNKVALTDAAARESLIGALKEFMKSAPRIHMALPAEPSGNFTKKIAVWIRQNIHQEILLDIGLQPTLAAGCLIRTNNKMFDMSLRHHFADSRHLLVEKIREIAGGDEPATTSFVDVMMVREAPASAKPKPAPAAPGQPAPAPVDAAKAAAPAAPAATQPAPAAPAPAAPAAPVQPASEVKK